MKLFDVKTDDITDYKETSLLLCFPHCSGKCTGCHSQHLITKYQEHPEEIKNYPLISICKLYNQLDTHSAIVMAGLEPLDSLEDVLSVIQCITAICDKHTTFVIYTGYNKQEYTQKFEKKIVDTLINFNDIYSKLNDLVVKVGRYDKTDSSDSGYFNYTLGVKLATSNQITMKYFPDGKLESTEISLNNKGIMREV